MLKENEKKIPAIILTCPNCGGQKIRPVETSMKGGKYWCIQCGTTFWFTWWSCFTEENKENDLTPSEPKITINCPECGYPKVVFKKDVKYSYGVGQTDKCKCKICGKIFWLTWCDELEESE